MLVEAHLRMMMNKHEDDDDDYDNNDDQVNYCYLSQEVGEVVEVEIRPRFPLFGGWKTKYTLGYNVPSYQLLFTAGNEYVLKIPFLDHVYDDMVVDKLTLKVLAGIH